MFILNTDNFAQKISPHMKSDREARNRFKATEISRNSHFQE